jgi:hypothetical protein
LPGRMPASNPKRLQRASFWFQSDARFFMKDEGGNMKEIRRGKSRLPHSIFSSFILPPSSFRLGIMVE